MLKNILYLLLYAVKKAVYLSAVIGGVILGSIAIGHTIVKTFLR